MKTVPPNPYSPYATATPAERHLFPTLFGPPKPGTLLAAGCLGLAVVPEQTVEVDPRTEDLPGGLCAGCIASLRGRTVPTPRPDSDCHGCGVITFHNSLCAMCRAEAHQLWTRTRTTTVPPPPTAPFLVQGGPIHVTPSAWCEHGDLAIGARFHGYYLNGEPHETHIDVLLPRCYLATVIGAVLAMVDIDPSPESQDRFTNAVNDTQNTVRDTYRQRLEDGETDRG